MRELLTNMNLRCPAGYIDQRSLQEGNCLTICSLARLSCIVFCADTTRTIIGEVGHLRTGLNLFTLIISTYAVT